MQTDFAGTAEIQHGCQHQRTDPKGGGLGRTMQAHVEIRQLEQAEGADQREQTADQQQPRHQPFDQAFHIRSYSMILPRSRYLATATVPTNPITAISSAASKYRFDRNSRPNRMSSAMALIYRVSSASTRSGMSGPLSSRNRHNSMASDTMPRQRMITLWSIRISPSEVSRNAA